MSPSEESPFPSFEELWDRVWPDKAHDLRAEPGDHGIYALIGWQQGRGLQGRIMGYRRAAEVLASTMINSGNSRDHDTVFFPFAMCWRHYVEMQLKTLSADIDRLLFRPVKKRGGHDIKQLWSEFRALLVEAYPGEQSRDRSIVGRIVGQLAAMDPDNQHFRYAQSRDGTPTLAGVDHIDIVEFHKAMLGVANFFEAVDTQVDVDTDNAMEARQYQWEAQQEIEQELREMWDDPEYG